MGEMDAGLRGWESRATARVFSAYAWERDR